MGRGVWVIALVTIAISAGCNAPTAQLSTPISFRSEALLWHGEFPRILVEIDYAREAPSAFALEALLDALDSAIGKPVDVSGPTLLPAEYRGERVWTLDELAGVEIDGRDSGRRVGRGEDGRALIHVIYLDGTVETHPNATGLNINQGAFVFDRDPRSSQLRPSVLAQSRELVERAVLIHEVGHAIGLVNDGIPMVRPHNDPESPLHSANKESVMYRYIDSMSAPVGILLPDEAPPYQFDADDLADIRYAQSFEPKAR